MLSPLRVHGPSLSCWPPAVLCRAIGSAVSQLHAWKTENRFSFFIILFYLFIFGCAGSLLLCGLPRVVASGAYSGCSVQASRCDGFSHCRTELLGMWPSVVAAPGLYSAGIIVGVHGLSCSPVLGSSRTRDQTGVSCIGRQTLYHWATREAWKTDFRIQYHVKILSKNLFVYWPYCVSINTLL